METKPYTTGAIWYVYPRANAHGWICASAEYTESFYGTTVGKAVRKAVETINQLEDKKASEDRRLEKMKSATIEAQKKQSAV